MHALVAAALLVTTYIASTPPLAVRDLAIAGDARTTLAVWTAIDDGVSRVHVSPLPAFHDAALPMSGHLQLAPAAAFDGTNFLVVWQEQDWQQTTTRAIRVSARGELLDAQPLDLGRSTTIPPRVIWKAGLYHVLAGFNEATVSAAGVVAVQPLFVKADVGIDGALNGDKVVTANATPACVTVPSGFSVITRCAPPAGFLTFIPGPSVTAGGPPLFVEANDELVIWSDGTSLFVRRNGQTQTLNIIGVTAGSLAGSLFAYIQNGRVCTLDLSDPAQKPEALTDGEHVATLALLARGDGRYALLYRTAPNPAKLLLREIGPQPPARRRTF
jgi:hypothetical protein